MAVAFAGVAAFGLLSKTGFLMDRLKAFEVGDQTISATDYRIFYKNSEMNLITNYGTALSLYYGVDLGQPISTPVSYTHLDVYKRQVSICALRA